MFDGDILYCDNDIDIIDIYGKIIFLIKEGRVHSCSLEHQQGIIHEKSKSV